MPSARLGPMSKEKILRGSHRRLNEKHPDGVAAGSCLGDGDEEDDRSDYSDDDPFPTELAFRSHT